MFTDIAACSRHMLHHPAARTLIKLRMVQCGPIAKHIHSTLPSRTATGAPAIMTACRSCAGSRAVMPAHKVQDTTRHDIGAQSRGVLIRRSASDAPKMHPRHLDRIPTGPEGKPNNVANNQCNHGANHSIDYRTAICFTTPPRAAPMSKLCTSVSTHPQLAARRLRIRPLQSKIVGS